MVATTKCIHYALRLMLDYDDHYQILTDEVQQREELLQS